MNKVILVGRIERITKLDKITLATICTHEHGKYEYIPVKIFNKEFFDRYFYPQKWCTIEGHITVNEYNGKYTTEIIADNIQFTGNATAEDKEIQNIYKEADAILKDNSFNNQIEA